MSGGAGGFATAFTMSIGAHVEGCSDEFAARSSATVAPPRPLRGAARWRGQLAARSRRGRPARSIGVRAPVDRSLDRPLPVAVTGPLHASFRTCGTCCRCVRGRGRSKTRACRRARGQPLIATCSGPASGPARDRRGRSRSWRRAPARAAPGRRHRRTAGTAAAAAWVSGRNSARTSSSSVCRGSIVTGVLRMCSPVTTKNRPCSYTSTGPARRRECPFSDALTITWAPSPETDSRSRSRARR